MKYLWQLLLFHCFYLCLALGALTTSIVAAEPFTHKPAAEITFSAQKGKYYQIQTKVAGTWTNIGYALKGAGTPITKLYPAGEYRVISPSDQWVKVWADEFNGNSLDGSKWAREENNYGGGNLERQAYRTEKKYCYIQDGHLMISVYRDERTTTDGKKQPYSSARIRTLNRAEWTYGRFEVRAKMPPGQGMWPAVWMLPTESPYGRWAAGGEIDILESRGSEIDKTIGALHFGGAWPRNTYLSHSYALTDKNSAEAFHVYALEWTADTIKWFVNDQLVKTRNKEEWFSEAAQDNPSAPYDQPFHLIINVAVDGRFFDQTEQKADLLAPDAFPQTLQVDYVRVYQWAE